LPWPSLHPCPFFQELEKSSQEEIDELADQLSEAQDQVEKLEAQVADLQKKTSTSR
jgi:hypothetical protein